MSAEEGMQGVVESLGEGIKGLGWGEAEFRDPRYKAFPISEENVREIAGRGPDLKLAFVDGGNAELVSAPTFSVHLVRACFSIFRGSEKVPPERAPQKVEFYLLARALAGEDGRIIYSGRCFALDRTPPRLLPEGRDLTLDSWDRSIMRGSFRGSISGMGEVARKFAEWRLAAEVAARELEEGDVVVRDGSLQTGITNEARYADAAYKAAEGAGVVFTGLAKTSALYTSTGNSLARAVMEAGEKAMAGRSWYYHPVAEIDHPDHRAELLFVKLNPESTHAFRYEIYREQARGMGREGLTRVLGALAANSRDISFPGYPYGLIDADGFARVGSGEAAYHRALLVSESSKAGILRELQEHVRAGDAHGILDGLRC